MKLQLLTILFICFITPSIHLQAQKLKPNFDKKEYIELLKIAQKTAIDISKWGTYKTVGDPERFVLAYRSPSIGLENKWDLWISKDSVATISIRGTTADAKSWLANFYAAMVPAKGTLELEKSFIFDYTLSEHPQAAVHVGWLVATAYLSRDILPKIDSCYKSGIKDFILTGHSQGGGITYLLSSYLSNLKKEHKLPQDIRFKTYCSAAPKPGNLYYAYTYEYEAREGWAFNVVNTADWVPETPFSIQTIYDYNRINIFGSVRSLIKKQPFPSNLVLHHIYNKLNNPGIRAQRNYEEYLGRVVVKSIKKHLPEFKEPVYYKSNNYVRTGNTIVLFANESYFKVFPDDSPNIWQHHFVEPYILLAEEQL